MIGFIEIKEGSLQLTFRAKNRSKVKRDAKSDIMFTLLSSFLRSWHHNQLRPVSCANGCLFLLRTNGKAGSS